MGLNPALLGTLVALQGSTLSQRDRTTAVATGLALGGANLVAGFMVGRGAVAESSLSAEKTAHTQLRADFDVLKQESEVLKQDNKALAAKLEHSQAMASVVRALPESVRKQLPAEQVEAFLAAFPGAAAIQQRSEVESSGKSHPHLHSDH